MDENNIIKKLIEHNERLDKLITKEEFNKSQNKLLSTQDEMITILRRLDQERIFTTEWIKRIEGDVEKQRLEACPKTQSAVLSSVSSRLRNKTTLPHLDFRLPCISRFRTRSPY